ncbi:MAG: type 1 glutamine amidotransferase, partial [Pseudomonadota bacterium]
MPTLTIIETGKMPAPIRGDWPDYPGMFEALLAPHTGDMQFETIALCEGEALPDPQSLDAILVTGAAAGVYEDHPWMNPLMDFIRWAGAAQTPQIGICFGHQAIAQALGGQVRQSNKGWGIGRHEYTLHTRPGWMNGYAADTFALGVSHKDQVEVLPPAAEIIASSAFTPYAALAYPAANAISFQGHPEFSPGAMKALYSVRKGTVFPEDMVEAAEQSLAAPIDNDLVGQWMARF